MMEPSLLLGLAGKTGSGKNYVAGLLEQRGFRNLDLDLVARRVVDQNAAEIDRQLGGGLIADGRIDRKLTARRVFSDPDLLDRLEQITYPAIEEETRRWLREAPDAPAVIHAVNLHKTTLPGDCDAILWISAPFVLRKRRVLKRDHRPWTEIKGRFDSQKALSSKLFSKDAETYTVRNLGITVLLNIQLNCILKPFLKDLQDRRN